MTTPNTVPGLLSEPPVLVYPSLAAHCGINKAVIVQQLHFLIHITRKARNRHNYWDERWWVYNTYQDWMDDFFPWLGKSTIKRLFLELEDEGVVLSRPNPHNKSDQTKWYTIDYSRWTVWFPQKDDPNTPYQNETGSPDDPYQNETGPVSKRADGYSETTRDYKDQRKESTTSPSGDVVDSESPWKHPENFTIKDIKALDLTTEQWQELLRNERQGRSSWGVRSGVVKHAQTKLDVHPLQEHKDRMMNGVAVVTGLSLSDFQNRKKIWAYIRDTLWAGERPCLPDELVSFWYWWQHDHWKGRKGEYVPLYGLANYISQYRTDMRNGGENGSGRDDNPGQSGAGTGEQTSTYEVDDTQEFLDRYPEIAR